MTMLWRDRILLNNEDTFLKSTGSLNQFSEDSETEPSTNNCDQFPANLAC